MTAIALRAAACVTVWLLFAPLPDARAQTATTTAWTASAGRYTFSLRDVSRHRRPLDASPISWETGSGTSALVRVTREAAKRGHRLEAEFSRAGRFEYRSPLRSDRAGASDRMTAMAARYDYQWFPFVNVGVPGLDIGVSGQLGANRLAFRRDVLADLTTRETRTSVGFGGAVLARWRRSRLMIDTSWNNGMAFTRVFATHGVEPLATRTQWGGGWSDQWRTGARVRIANAASIVVEHVLAREYSASSHMAYAGRQRSLSAGVTYAR